MPTPLDLSIPGFHIPNYDAPVPMSATRDIGQYVQTQMVSYPGTPSPMYAAIVAAPLELFRFKYGSPYSPVNEYDEAGRTSDIYAYDNVQWQAPLETFSLYGTVHAAYADATVGSEMITPQNLSAPTQAYSGQQGYGLP